MVVCAIEPKHTFIMQTPLRLVRLAIILKRNWKTIVLAVAIILALPVIFVFSVYSGVFGHLQTKKELLSYKNAIATTVLSAEGSLIGNVFSENRTNISYNQIPPNLINALIATEDARFYEHKGIDSRSFMRVLFKSIILNDRSSGGGSTISQQLAKNMFGRKKSGHLALLLNKTKEAILAHRLEKLLSKEEILTLYLNTVSFGENIFGIGTAARRYFNKKVEFLRPEESAVLIGMLKANTLYNPRIHPANATSRRNVVLKLMEKNHFLSAAEADSLCKLPLVQNFKDIESDGPADYFLVHVKNEADKILKDIEAGTGKRWNIGEDGLIITTSLNLTLQQYALESFREHLSVMQKKLWDQYKSQSGKKLISQIAAQELKSNHMEGRANEINIRQIFDWNGSRSDSVSVTDSLKQALLILHAGLLAIDPQSGYVKAWIGGIDFKSQQYDQIFARRQLASTFKPVLYAEAFELGFEPCQYLDNDSVAPTGVDLWSPVNYDHTNGGKYSLAGALAHSMNIPTYNLFLNVGFESLDSMWRNLGFSFDLVNTPSLALGTAEGSIMETALAYSAFANGGYRIEPQSLVSIKSSDGETIWQNQSVKPTERILSERSATLISTILQKAVREGTGAAMSSVYGVNLPIAGKTGTSQDFSDAWFTAFNPNLVIVTRVGASSRAIHFNSGSNGSGSTLALPLVALTLKKVQANDTLRHQLIGSFPELPQDLQGTLDCPDFKEKTFGNKFMDLFRNKRIYHDEGTTKAKKRGFFRRLFGK
jgi:penicillin-binding protein 1A